MATDIAGVTDMSDLSKIEIADDAGNEIREMTVPIPFYIRVKLEEGMTRYRVRLIDDESKIRGQYIGKIMHKYLELHVPLIKLPKPGKLRVIVEESSDVSDYTQEYQVSILYLDYIPEKVQEDIDTVDVETQTPDLPQDEVKSAIKREKILTENNSVADIQKVSFKEEVKLLATIDEEIRLLDNKHQASSIEEE
ncbi:MAG: hypothetical protein ACFE9L_05890 [Candidatus Hodarchaeota archaeon]